jgi:lysophospholipase L1-like esterase
MTFLIAFLATIAFVDVAAAAAPEECELPQSFLSSDSDLPRVMKDIKDNHRLNISVIGSGSSSLPGPDGPHFAYPARLEEALRRRLPGNEINVVAHVQSRETTAAMVVELKKILGDDKPALVVWQAGTSDALKGVEPEEFRASLDDGIDTIEKTGAEVILMNMQYSPRTESMLDVSAYADVMRWVAQQRGALLFDRLGIMRSWNDSGTFDLYTTTRNYDMARRVHDCIGRGLASQIIDAAHLNAEKMQTTR